MEWAVNLVKYWKSDPLNMLSILNEIASLNYPLWFFRE